MALELYDTSAFARRNHQVVRASFRNAAMLNEIALCDQVWLEVLHSARNQGEFRTIRVFLTGFPRRVQDASQWVRAIDVYERLAGVGPQHDRSVKHQDLLIAACAEAHGLTLVHYDADFDTIAAVTGQPMRWLAPRGTL
ncbi:MAG: PIN domain-containing protein [Candidatus Dormibacteraeota bacterium]|nr:PIN domain-containing protein [Candidatus Dormibacteraeota bacterium]